MNLDWVWVVGVVEEEDVDVAGAFASNTLSLLHRF